MVPENLILAKTGASSGELAGICAADNGEGTTNMGRLGAKVARFEMVARTSTSCRGHKRASSTKKADPS